MKILRLFALILILAGLTQHEVNGQSLVRKGFTWHLRTDYGYYPAVYTMSATTPSGNILHKHEYQVDLDDPIVPEKGINKIRFKTHIYYEGAFWLLRDAEGIVHSDGKCIIIFHKNGAGTVTPQKKDKG